MKVIIENWRKYLKESAKEYVFGVKNPQRVGNKFGGWVPVKRKKG